MTKQNDMPSCQHENVTHGRCQNCEIEVLVTPYHGKRADLLQPQVDLDALYRNTCNCEGDGGQCSRCEFESGWNAAIDHIAALFQKEGT